MRRAASALLASVETPPGARPYAPSIEHFFGGADARVTLEQEFEAPGRFPDTKEWYRQQLEPKGWRIFDPAATFEGHVEWCKAPWFFTLEGRAYYDDAVPRHRFMARAEWRSRFTPDRCPLSAN